MVHKWWHKTIFLFQTRMISIYLRFVIQNLLCIVCEWKRRNSTQVVQTNNGDYSPGKNPNWSGVRHWGDRERGDMEGVAWQEIRKLNICTLKSVWYYGCSSPSIYYGQINLVAPCQLWWWLIVMCSALVHSSGGFLPLGRVPWLLTWGISQGLDDDSSESLWSGPAVGWFWLLMTLWQSPIDYWWARSQNRPNPAWSLVCSAYIGNHERQVEWMSWIEICMILILQVEAH